MNMKQNVGATDKMIRIGAGVVLLLILLFVQSGIRWIGLLGIVMLATAFIGSCPIYTLLGMSTKETK